MGSRKKAGPRPEKQKQIPDDKIEIFIREYLIDFNASRSAVAAGYSQKGADVAGHRLLANAKVQSRIKEATARRVDKLEITGERILQELAKIAFSNIAQFAEWTDKGWEWKDSSKLSEMEKAAIQELSETSGQYGGSSKLKMYDKLKALELLGRWREMGLWKDNIEVAKPKGEKSKEFNDLLGEVRAMCGAMRYERGK
jgi:phage terminase small subunit